MGVVVHIDKFSGPMALLLHLIRSQEMDIFDINIQEITKQYLESIKSMKKLNLEVAGDFIAMAATLIQIKSKMLLPQYNENGDVMDEADPRRDLVQKLLEYQMYQEAGHNLYKRELLGRNIWARGSREDIETPEGEIVLEEDNALYSLIASFRSVIKNVKKVVHMVSESMQSISERIWELRDRLVIGRSARLSEILDADAKDRRGQLLITFLSLLELAKIGIVSLFQSENFHDIHIETKAPLTEDAISKVESYDSQVTGTETANEFWLNEEDIKAANEEENALQQMTLAPTPLAQEVREVQAATDEEIEAEIQIEEKLYGQEI